MTGSRRRCRLEGVTGGEDGPDDPLVRVDGVDAGRVLRDGAEVREGLTLCLDLPGAVSSPPIAAV